MKTVYSTIKVQLSYVSGNVLDLIWKCWLSFVIVNKVVPLICLLTCLNAVGFFVALFLFLKFRNLYITLPSNCLFILYFI